MATAESVYVPWHPVIEVRCVGPCTYEARTHGGYYSAIGGSAKEATAHLRSKLPRHEEPTVITVPAPAPRPEL